VVLSFHYSILLRNTQGRKLLINTVLKIKLIKRGISELGKKNECSSEKAVRTSQGNIMRITNKNIT
jgi:hypothetical protein